MLQLNFLDAPEGFYQTSGHGYDASGLSRAAGYAEVCRISRFDESPALWGRPEDMGWRCAVDGSKDASLACGRRANRLSVSGALRLLMRGAGGVGERAGLWRIVKRDRAASTLPRTFGRVSCPLRREGYRTCFDLEAAPSFCGRSRHCLADQPDKCLARPKKQDRCCSAARFTSSSNFASFLSISCRRMLLQTPYPGHRDSDCHFL
jgi:hypothetical protein